MHWTLLLGPRGSPELHGYYSVDSFQRNGTSSVFELLANTSRDPGGAPDTYSISFISPDFSRS